MGAGVGLEHFKGVSQEWHGFKTRAAARQVSVGSLPVRRSLGGCCIKNYVLKKIGELK